MVPRYGSQQSYDWLSKLVLRIERVSDRHGEVRRWILVEIKGRGDVKAASVKKTEKMIDKEKIDGSVKIESEKKTEKREEKKSDGEKIVGAVKFESEEKSDGVVAEVQNVATEVAKAKEIKEKDCDGEKKEKEDGNNGSAIEK